MTIKLSELAANPLTLLSAVAPPALGDLMLVNDISEAVTINKTKAMTLQTLATMLAPFMEGIKVNGLYFSTEATNPATSLGYGTWTAYAAGRVPIGVGTSDAVYAAGATGGASFHTNTLAELAAHVHLQYAHNHIQDAHNHTQHAHGHTGISHNHTQNAHSHSVPSGDNVGGVGFYQSAATSSQNTSPATATNQAATAGVNDETATNQAATPTNQAATATNQNAGSGTAWDNTMPWIAVFIWRRIA